MKLLKKRKDYMDDLQEMFCDKTKQKRKQCKKHLKYVGMYLGAFILGMLARFFIGICAKL